MAIGPGEGPVHAVHHFASEAKAIVGLTERRRASVVGLVFGGYLLGPQELEGHRTFGEADAALFAVLAALIANDFGKFVEVCLFQAELFGDAFDNLFGRRLFAGLYRKGFIEVAKGTNIDL